MRRPFAATYKLVLTALFIALGLVLPFLTGQIKEIGDTLLPMHLPVMLCGLICGWPYGLACGAVLPLFRNLLFARPPMPNALWMSFELAAYGLVIALLYSLFHKKNTKAVLLSLLGAMAAGRVVLAAAKAVIFGLAGDPFSLSLFMTQSVLDAVPGMVLQLVLIPVIMRFVKKKGETP